MRYSIPIREFLTLPMRLRFRWYLLPLTPPKLPDVLQCVPEYDIEDLHKGWKEDGR